MGFCHLKVKGPRPLPSTYPRTLRTLGDHIRTVRLDRGLEQTEVAKLLGVNVGTVGSWERGRKPPKPSCWPRIFEFLGYEPELLRGESLGERLLWARQRRGLSQKKLARLLGISFASIQRIEGGENMRAGRVLKAVERFLEEKD